MNLSVLLAKMPKPILVIGVLVIALAVIIYSNPLKDECEVRTNIFLKEMRGIINSVRVKKNKTQFAQIIFLKDRCKDANSIGGCEDYFNALRKLTQALAVFPQHCQEEFAKENEAIVKHIYDGIQILALVAWGEKPPGGATERLGWLNEEHVKTFCRLKKTYLNLTSDEDSDVLRDRVYLQYPNAWPESIPDESKKPENRPKALKTPANPSGSLDKAGIFERSLFSMRCDLYQ